MLLTDTGSWWWSMPNDEHHQTKPYADGVSLQICGNDDDGYSRYTQVSPPILLTAYFPKHWSPVPRTFWICSVAPAGSHGCHTPFFHTSKNWLISLLLLFSNLKECVCCLRGVTMWWLQQCDKPSLHCTVHNRSRWWCIQIFFSARTQFNYAVNHLHIFHWQKFQLPSANKKQHGLRCARRIYAALVGDLRVCRLVCEHFCGIRLYQMQLWQFGVLKQFKN